MVTDSNSTLISTPIDEIINKMSLVIPNENFEAMYLPPPTRRTTNGLLRLLRDRIRTVTANITNPDQSVNQQLTIHPETLTSDTDVNFMKDASHQILREMCERANNINSASLNEGTTSKAVVTTISKTSNTPRNSPDNFEVRPLLPAMLLSGRRMLHETYCPDETSYALAMETSVAAQDADTALQLFSELEGWRNPYTASTTPGGGMLRHLLIVI